MQGAASWTRSLLILQFIEVKDRIDHRPSLLGVVLGMRQHGDLPPYANASLENFLGQGFSGIRIRRVTFGDLKVRGATKVRVHWWQLRQSLLLINW